MKLNKQHQLETHQLFPEHIKRNFCWELSVGLSLWMLKGLACLQSPTGYGYRIMKFVPLRRRNYDFSEMRFYFITSFSPCEDGKDV